MVAPACLLVCCGKDCRKAKAEPASPLSQCVAGARLHRIVAARQDVVD